MLQISDYRDSADNVTIHSIFRDITNSKKKVNLLKENIQELQKTHSDLEHNTSILVKTFKVKSILCGENTVEVKIDPNNTSSYQVRYRSLSKIFFFFFPHII